MNINKKFEDVSLPHGLKLSTRPQTLIKSVLEEIF